MAQKGKKKLPNEKHIVTLGPGQFRELVRYARARDLDGGASAVIRELVARHLKRWPKTLDSDGPA